jgi:hypothetical protein
VVSFVKTFDPSASPPPVNVLGQVGAEPGASTTTYATSPPGQLGVACFTGSADDPAITLAGPFPIGP